jgi:hypothetical protein
MAQAFIQWAPCACTSHCNLPQMIPALGTQISSVIIRAYNLDVETNNRLVALERKMLVLFQQMQRMQVDLALLQQQQMADPTTD